MFITPHELTNMVQNNITTKLIMQKSKKPALYPSIYIYIQGEKQRERKINQGDYREIWWLFS